MALRPSDPGYRAALIVSCVFFMMCSAGMLVINKLVLRSVGLPITASALLTRARRGLMCGLMLCALTFARSW